MKTIWLLNFLLLAGCQNQIEQPILIEPQNPFEQRGLNSERVSIYSYANPYLLVEDEGLRFLIFLSAHHSHTKSAKDLQLELRVMFCLDDAEPCNDNSGVFRAITLILTETQLGLAFFHENQEESTIYKVSNRQSLRALWMERERDLWQLDSHIVLSEIGELSDITIRISDLIIHTSGGVPMGKFSEGSIFVQFRYQEQLEGIDLKLFRDSSLAMQGDVIFEGNHIAMDRLDLR